MASLRGSVQQWGLLGLLGLLQLTAHLAVAANGYDKQWVVGHATWYGDPHGEGSSGGACGYEKLTGTPYGPKIAAGNEAIFQGGLGCGQCYDVKCTLATCNPEPTRIVITDQCPGGVYCSKSNPAFDLSGAAISAMAMPSKDDELRNVGQYDILYKRVPCDFGSHELAFHMDAGATAFYLSFTVKYLGGPGDIERVEIKHSGSESFEPAKHNWGANWMLINTSGQAFKGPYSIKVRAKLNGHSVVAEDAIPEGFEPGKLYESKVQLKD